MPAPNACSCDSCAAYQPPGSCGSRLRPAHGPMIVEATMAKASPRDPKRSPSSAPRDGACASAIAAVPGAATGGAGGCGASGETALPPKLASKSPYTFLRSASSACLPSGAPARYCAAGICAVSESSSAVCCEATVGNVRAVALIECVRVGRPACGAPAAACALLRAARAPLRLLAICETNQMMPTTTQKTTAPPPSSARVICEMIAGGESGSKGYEPDAGGVVGGGTWPPLPDVPPPEIDWRISVSASTLRMR